MGGSCGAGALPSRPWTAAPSEPSRSRRRARSGRAPPGSGRRGRSRASPVAVSPGDLADLVEGTADAMGETMDAVMTATVPNVTSHPYTLHLHTDTHFFPGLANYDAVGFHVNVLAVLAAAGIFFPVAGLLLVSQLWERVGKELVFGKDPEDDPDADEAIVLCGVDCSAYPIFRHPKIVRAALFAERWHHGQYRRSGEPYVTHCVEAARILAALLPQRAAERGERKYVDAVAACILHDVVDDTECDVEDVRAQFGSRVAKLVQDVSTLGKLPQILRRYQRRSVEGELNLRAAAAARAAGGGDSPGGDSPGGGDTAGGPGPKEEEDVAEAAYAAAKTAGQMRIDTSTTEDIGTMELEELAKLRKLLLVMVDDPRVFLIKIADRLHNMRTMYAVNSAKSKFVANETLQVWCSFAEQLGMFGAKAEMEDLSFAVVNPDAFRAVINARVDEWYRPDDGKSSKKAKTRTKTDLSEDDAASTDLSSEVESDEPASDDDDDASTSEAASKSAFTMTWEPPTGADVQMFFERVLRGENAGTPRRHSPRGEKERAMEAERRARQVRLEAMAAAREEEREKRAKPLTEEQEELKALLACVPPFDLLQASERNSRTAAAAAAAMMAADEATAATAADGRPTVGGASLDASLRSLRQCQATTMRSLQLDSLAPGLRVEITGRLKSAHSTHLKMRRKNIDFGQVCDARALRIVIGEPGEAPGTKDEVEACYAVVNAIHKLYRAVPGEYDDYVANKKRSGYQSLHTAVTGPDGALLEFQVRTRAMHEAAEFGDAAHWLYKDFINAVKRRPNDESAIGGDGGGGGPEDVDVVAAGVARARASPTAETNVDRSYVGQPVQIVWDVGTSGGGGRLSAGVVCFAEGSRIHVVEPRRGDVLAPGVGSTGLAETAEWVAMGLHRDALDRAVRANRVEPRQNGPGYLVLEFALCSDGRWHKVDAFDRKLATTAELLDEEALVTALRAARAAEVEAAASMGDCAGDDVECNEMAVALEAEEVIAAFDQKAEEAAAAAAAGETLERGSFFASSAGGEAEASGGEEGPATPAAVLQTSPDDEMAAARVRAMQAVLKAYLSDSPQLVDAPFPDGFDSLDDDDDDDDTAGDDDYDDDGSGFRYEPSLVVDPRDTTGRLDTDRRVPVSDRFRAGLGLGGGGSAVMEKVPPKQRRWSANLTVEEALAQAREDLRESAERAAEAAKAERRRARRARKEAEWQSGEVESPIFAIAQAGVAKEVEEAAPRARAGPMFKAKDAAELQAAMRKTRGTFGELSAPSISVNEESVMVITWRREDEAGPLQPELVKLPKGSTAKQLTDGEGDDPVNVNGEPVKPDTSLKNGDMLFLE
ncbi:predicted protein [Micromonas commoda]|uniref:Uncharacterized protein n=1 Tax=Micromonas commoda (strain RCC299 / NOUM17 / CCMP2709) TaxID=296587 RepID=C1EAY9_MICCC|nr:predicted protein [Micromonas commoda]ACO65290.1 predicted protein [Micromonas commoda]|eukprot:XP_002504032.1 predicted protein [Micromonas commoda]